MARRYRRGQPERGNSVTISVTPPRPRLHPRSQPPDSVVRETIRRGHGAASKAGSAPCAGGRASGNTRRRAAWRRCPPSPRRPRPGTAHPSPTRPESDPTLGVLARDSSALRCVSRKGRSSKPSAIRRSARSVASRRATVLRLHGSTIKVAAATLPSVT